MHTLVRATLLNKWNAYYLLNDMVWKAATKIKMKQVFYEIKMPTNRGIVNNIILRESMQITSKQTYQQPWECI